MRESRGVMRLLVVIRFSPIRAVAVQALAGLTVATSAHSGWGDCEHAYEDHGNLSGEREYKINVQSFGTYITYLNQNDAAQAVIQGADTWNEQANAGYFKYTGTTTRYTDLPNDIGSCNSQGIDYSLVKAVPQASCPCSGNCSYTYPRCKDFWGNGTQFEIILCSDYTGISGNQDWFLGDIQSGKKDMVKTLTHEIGHSLDLGHPGTTEEATMRVNYLGQSRGRDLYQWDIQCSQENAGDRELDAYYREQNSSGTIGSESTVPGSFEIAKASAGAFFESGSGGGSFDDFSATVKDDGGWHWLKWVSTGYAQSISDLVSIGPRDAVWRESPTIQRIFYSDYLEQDSNGTSDPYDARAKHRVRYRRFDSDSPTTGKAGGSMKFCSSMTSFMYCTNSSTYRDPLFSGKPIASAWNGYIDRSVFAWANQTRSDTTADRELMVSVGVVNSTHYVVPTPDTVPHGLAGDRIRTRVAPGIACKPSSGYNCIVAYVDEKEATGKIRVKRFYSYQGTYRYHSYFPWWEAYDVGGQKTASSIAAWYNSSTQKFYLAFRQAGSNQRLYVYSSSNGTSWSFDYLGPEIVTGPTAVSYLDGSTNMLVYLKP